MSNGYLPFHDVDEAAERVHAAQVVYDRERHELISRSARLAYPVRDGIPVMLEDEARKLTPEEWEAGKE